MILNLHSLAFGTETASGGGNPAWGTEMGQGEGYRFSFENCEELITAMVYKSVTNPQNRVYCPLGKGGNQSCDYEFVLGSLFEKVFVNGIPVNGKFLLLIVKKLVGTNHVGRKTLKYNPRMTLDNVDYNENCYANMASALGVSPNGSWFVSEINVKNQDELHFTAHILNTEGPTIFDDSADRSRRLQAKLQAFAEQSNNISLKTYLGSIADDVEKAILNADDKINHLLDYLRAMRTKPFLLLAGISGTGKSRIVKQMAFDSCPDKDNLRIDATSPGNYCLIEVKPNWHDSSELLGYESKIGRAHYQLTPFVKFLAKAMLYPKVPFFVCLDEMNLAPVEQYFAEFLSVLESRTKIDGHIVSEPLIKASVFSNSEYEKDLKHEIFDVKIKEKDGNGIKIYEADLSEEETAVYEQLKEKGLRIPQNVVVIGTVNMDETTHQFSRKVIDRAMTIEMNLPDGDPFMDFFTNSSELEYRANPTSPSLYLATEAKASEVIKVLAENNSGKTDWLKGEVAKVLTNLNSALDGTPFKVAYRVQNELMLYFYQLWLENKTAKWRDILNTTVDQILMMKVLPRIEGDEELLEKPLDRLIEFSTSYPNAMKKLSEMKSRLGQSQFTSFWP